LEPLEILVYRRLSALNLTIATAESCTGGLIAHRLTNVSGISNHFLGGLVAYSNAIKMQFLGVAEEALIAHGAVSDVVARQMAEGARERFGADVAVGVTGIAGPGGGTPEKPVGLVYIAVATAAKTVVSCNVFEGNREQIKHQSAETALTMLLETIA